MRDLKAAFSHAQDGYETFPYGEFGKRFLKGDIDQNVFLDNKVKNVGQTISVSEHCTNFPCMKKLEYTLFMSEMPTGHSIWYACYPHDEQVANPKSTIIKPIY